MNLTMNELEAAPSPLQDKTGEIFRKAIWVSVSIHALFFLSVTVKNIFFTGEPLVYENAIRVDLVALPDKLPPAEQAAPPTPVTKPPPVAVKTPPKELPKVNDSINLEKSRAKEKDAMKKLREMEVMDKIRKQLEAEQRIKAAAKVFKGNQLSSGTELHGLSKIDHDNYIAEVKRKIYDSWDLPEWLAQKNLKAQVLARFDQHGNLIFKQLIKSSGNPSYDENIMEALRKASPVAAPPEKLAKIIGQEGILVGFPD